MTNSNAPRTISKQVNRLISKLNLKAPPVFVKVQPESGAIVSECFQNVERKVLSSGGKMLCGWQIWEWPNVIVTCFLAKPRRGLGRYHTEAR